MRSGGAVLREGGDAARRLRIDPEASEKSFDFGTKCCYTVTVQKERVMELYLESETESGIYAADRILSIALDIAEKMLEKGRTAIMPRPSPWTTPEPRWTE